VDTVNETAVLGKIVKAVGRKGEVKLLPGPDFWSKALNAGQLILHCGEDEQRWVHVDRFRAKGKSYILKLSGVEGIDEAEALVGCGLEIVVSELEESARPDDVMPFQVMGMIVVLPDGERLGKVIDMLLGPSQNCLIVENGGDRYIVPNVPEVVLSIDFDQGVVEIDPPAGLLDLRW